MSEAVKRLRKAIVDVLTEDVRQALRDGCTIAQVMTAYPAATKRFVEQQRAILAAIDGSVPDARSRGVQQEIERLTDQGMRVVEIAAALKISASAVYHHRRKIKKVK